MAEFRLENLDLEKFLNTSDLELETLTSEPKQLETVLISNFLNETNSSNPPEFEKTQEDVFDSKPSGRKRGRKPSSSSTESCYKKKKETIDGKVVETISFGNSRVKIGSDEYKKKRLRNNEAVKKCRQKANIYKQEMTDLITKFRQENEKLKEKLAIIDQFKESITVVEQLQRDLKRINDRMASMSRNSGV